MLRHLVAASLALLLHDAALAKSGERTRCPGGKFMAEAPLVAGDTATEAGAVVVIGGQITVGGSCAATAAAVTPTKHGTIVRARWESCRGVTGRVRLRAVIRSGCSTLVGVIRARHQRRHFAANRQPECGNGVREGREPCDGGSCCTTDCRAATDPSCPGGETCTADADCGVGTFCSRPAGQCEGAGVCQSTHVFCTAVAEPVCGCDGHTYSSACAAEQHGVNVASPGECGAEQCGTIAGIACGDGQFCEQRPGECHVADAAGSCVDVPATCLGILDPVCGCDGNTYVNDCYRLQARVEKAHDGHCGHCLDVLCTPGTKPVDTDGDDCPDRCFGECDRDCDCSRTGGPLPLPCPMACTTTGPCGGFWRCEDHVCVPKCGAIPNDTCQPPPPPDCTTNADCEKDSAGAAFCDGPPGQCDGRGVCAPRSVVCPEIYAPVCGCDGETYGNACEAAGHGVRVAHEGACHCAPPPCAAVLRPVDTDGDGCPDTCRRPCDTACDCGPIPVANKADVCPLAALCPSPFCGSFWTCEEGFCQDHCGVVPPGTDICHPSED